MEIGAVQKGSKGKKGDGKGKKGKDGHKEKNINDQGKNNQQNRHPGDKGKSQSSEFQGYSGKCGAWGHRQRDCAKSNINAAELDSS
eukprot:9784707-Alexandrium_andersonii.AAC.1